ncbi:MAG: MFS transporter [Dehalococcoidia bacterium]|nr:MFS transporter [Dehalococcoidia bacterium]
MDRVLGIFKIPPQIIFTIVPLGLIIMGDSILYVILPSNYEFFKINSFLGVDSGFWIGFILSINRFVRIFSNVFSVKIIKILGLRNSMFVATFAGSLSTLGYGLFKGVLLIVLMRIIWGFSYSIFRLSYYLKVYSYEITNYGRHIGFCLSIQRLGSFIAVTLGVYISVKYGYFNVLLLLSLLLIPALFIVYNIKEININSITKPSLSWNLLYIDQIKDIRKNILIISFFKFSSSFTSNGLAIATITPFLISINKNTFSYESIIILAGIVVGFRWLADIMFGLIFGTLSDKFGRKSNIIISAITMLISIIIAVSNISFYVSVFCIILMFFISVSLETSLDALIGETAPEKEKSSIISRYSTWQDLGAAFGPILGFVIGSYFGISYGYIFSIILIFISLYLYLKVFKITTSLNN